LPRVAPDGVSFHTSRLRRTGPVDTTTLGGMNAQVDAALELLPLPFLDVVFYHCTMGSLLYDPDRLLQDMSARSGLPTIATTASIVAALRHLGLKRVCLVTPYSQ